VLRRAGKVHVTRFGAQKSEIMKYKAKLCEYFPTFVELSSGSSDLLFICVIADLVSCLNFSSRIYFFGNIILRPGEVFLELFAVACSCVA
jgi:hypothetical protein